MEGKWLALLFLFTVLHPIPTASAFGDYNISESMAQWMISACMTDRTCRPGRAKQAFGIHGLWPVKSAGKAVVSCRPCHSFEARKLPRALFEQLVNLWPSLYDDRYYEFWKLEWEKHGCCFDDSGYPKEALANYFQTAFSLAQRYNIWAYLTREGIKVDVAYDVSVITDAIKKGLGDESNVVQIQCRRLKGKLVVTQIFVCVNKRATALTQCPTGRQIRKCGDREFYPNTCTNVIQLAKSIASFSLMEA
ncbi:unnamed protein product [Dovyalis caffra]|uniref:Uncharacterized protein n=1 Tax=Dovyalis caffra TaxID=77055 RepID=A0AAV1R3K5_9ROSI|nr:unnamed protein product [Dovyalis caffra]